MKLSNHTDIEDFVRGASFLGAGGGGRPHEGLRALKMAMEEKGAIEWTDADNIPDDSLCLCPFMMGSAGPITEQKKRDLKKMGLEEEKYPVNLIPAIREWEEYSGKKADVIVPLEANRMKRILVRGTMTQSLKIGRLLRKAETGEITLRQAMKRCGAVQFIIWISKLFSSSFRMSIRGYADSSSISISFSLAPSYTRFTTATSE